MIVFALFYCAHASAQRSVDMITYDDRLQLDSAVYLMDHNNAKDAVKILDRLCKKYKGNYTIEYERLYAYYLDNDFNRIVKEGPKLYENPEIEPQCFQLVGNAHDMLGDADGAMKTYDEGLKLFPNSGYLYLEKGNIHLMHQRYDDAVKCYLKGVEVQPDFASNYYRLAMLYASSSDPLWAIIYGEVVCNLAPGTERCAEMGKLIYDLFNENVNVDDENGIHVTLAKEHTIYMSSDSSKVNIPFPIMYELGLTKSLIPAKISKGQKLTVAQIAELRKGALEHIDSIAPGYYNLSLLDFHRKLIKSGHWMAYNMWLMSPGAEEETEQWADSDNGARQLKGFAAWLNENRFTPTVDQPTVMTKVFKSHELNIPSSNEIATAEGCREHRDDALRLAKWYLEQPTDSKNTAQLEVSRFLLLWMTNTDEFEFALSDNAAVRNIELLRAYLAAMIEHAIEFGVKKTDEAMYCEVMLQVLDYYKRNKDVLSTNQSMEDYLKMDGPALRNTLAEEYKRIK